jgi:regulator of protease activity HflC (stomatin/prohibitin superfamily)
MARKDDERTRGKGADSKEDEEAEKPTLRERIAAFLGKAQFATTTLLIVFLLGLTYLWPKIFISIEPGHLGVMYRYFGGGTVTDRSYSEGLHVIAPWNTLTPYEVRLQVKEVQFAVLSEEGLSLDVKVSIRYHVRPAMVGFLHKDVGPEYYERLVKPEVQAHVRRTFGSRPAHEIYGSARDILQELAQVPVMGKVGMEGAESGPVPYVDVEELKLLDIGLPELVQSSIAEKYRQEQLMLEYRFKLEREEKEAERKRTEAAGIRDYNIIASRVSPDLLRWRGIDALSDLAKSNNSKVVVLGQGSGGVPFILNLNDVPASTSSAAPSASAAASAAPVASTTATGSTETASAVASATPSTAASAAPSAVASAAPSASASSAPTTSAAPEGSVASVAKSAP